MVREWRSGAGSRMSYDGCRRPEARLPPKGREWEVEGLQPGSNRYKKAVNQMWAEFEEYGDEEFQP